MNNTGARRWPCADANCSKQFDMDMNVPDIIMEGVARHSDRFFAQTEFYRMAANGTLPQFTYLLPPNAMSDHPCYDVGGGERLLKDVYEALRAGPGWNDTLLWVGYDDAGVGHTCMLPGPTQPSVA